MSDSVGGAPPRKRGQHRPYRVDGTGPYCILAQRQGPTDGV